MIQRGRWKHCGWLGSREPPSTNYPNCNGRCWCPGSDGSSADWHRFGCTCARIPCHWTWPWTCRGVALHWSRSSAPRRRAAREILVGRYRAGWWPTPAPPCSAVSDPAGRPAAPDLLSPPPPPRCAIRTRHLCRCVPVPEFNFRFQSILQFISNQNDDHCHLL